MKLRNKKTREIFDGSVVVCLEEENGRFAIKDNPVCESISELNERFEDYKPAEPFIKEEKIRKALRAWAEVNYDITEVYYNKNKRTFGETTSLKVITVSELLDDNLEDNGVYTITELCGEEEE